MTCGLTTTSSQKLRRRLGILAIIKAYLNVSFSLLVIHKHFSMILIFKDHIHIMYIAYKPLYNKAYLFRPLVYVVKSL